MANTERLQGTLEFLKNHPDQHVQAAWLEGRAGECGTVGCYAGWATALYGPEEGWSQGEKDDLWFHDDGRPGAHVSILAEELLDLTEDEGAVLFAGGNDRNDLETMISDLVAGQLHSLDYYRDLVDGEVHRYLVPYVRRPKPPPEPPTLDDVEEYFKNYLNSEDALNWRKVNWEGFKKDFDELVKKHREDT
jgi:hypothetical protein